jgi:hypothetical protein
MSENNSALPDPVSAYQHLFDRVHAQVFLNKLASYGIVPTTEAELEDLFTVAAQLRPVPGAEKQAAASSRFESAASALGAVANPQQAPGAFQESALKQAVAELAADPDIYNSVLAVKAAEAAILAGDY